MMKFDDLESRLTKLSRRGPPTEWRSIVLHDANSAVASSQRSSKETPCFRRNARSYWSWNWNWAWSALAASWLGILGLRSLTPRTNPPREWVILTTRSPVSDTSRTTIGGNLDDTVLREQRRLLAQLLQDNEAPPAAAEPKGREPVRLGPRGDRPADGFGRHDPLNFAYLTTTA